MAVKDSHRPYPHSDLTQKLSRCTTPTCAATLAPRSSAEALEALSEVWFATSRDANGDSLTCANSRSEPTQVVIEDLLHCLRTWPMRSPCRDDDDTHIRSLLGFPDRTTPLNHLDFRWAFENLFTKSRDHGAEINLEKDEGLWYPLQLFSSGCRKALAKIEPLPLDGKTLRQSLANAINQTGSRPIESAASDAQFWGLIASDLYVFISIHS